MRPRRLIFLGPPGTGKGTQAQRMSERFGLVAISSGDTLRAEIKAGSEVGHAAEQYVKAGTLVPDAVITEVMLAGVDKLGLERGFILDGFPRTVPQAEALRVGLNARKMKLDAAVDFRMDDGRLIERIVNRLICGNCGTPYNRVTSPPRTPGVCDRCGGELTQRVDDTEEVVRTRLDTYRELTAPLIEYYESRGLLRPVDASASVDKVEEQVASIVESLDVKTPDMETRFDGA